MKKISVLVAVMVMATSASFAQKGKPAKGKAAKVATTATAAKVATTTTAAAATTAMATTAPAATTAGKPGSYGSTDGIGLQWYTMEHDFKEIPQNVPATAEFKFRNNGKKPIILSNVQASCGCTAPDWPKEPIMPGKDGVIKATYNAASPNAFTKTVTVTAKDIADNMVLRISGTVKAKEGAATTPAAH